MSDTVLIRVNSHRARNKMYAMIGKQQCYFSWDRHCTGGFFRIAADDVGRVLSIKGIAKARDGTDIHRCLDL